MPSTLDIDWIRSQFPALSMTVDGQPATFFDAPGGTQVPQRVVDAVSNAMITGNANLHGPFTTSVTAEKIVNDAHQAVADFLGCAAREVIFGPNMTTLTFAISQSIGRGLASSDEVIVTKLDHDANHAPWKALTERGVVVREVDIRLEDCTLDLDDFHAKLSEKTKLVAVGYASNSVGTVNDLETIIAAAHAVGAWVFVDAVHYGPHGPIDVRALDCDFLACSAYKFFGPHQGLLYGKAEHLEALRPYKVRPADDQIPWCFETGTQNHEAMAGVTAAIDYLAELGRRADTDTAARSRRDQLVAAMSASQAYERDLAEKLIAGLVAIPGLRFYGIADRSRFGERTPTVSIRIDGIHPREIAERLGKQGFFVWDGNYYAINLTEALGVESDGGTVRIGLVHYNTKDEVDRLLAAIRALS